MLRDTSQLKSFNGLLVRHRFNTPIKEVAVKYSSIEQLKALYNKLKNNTTTKNSARVEQEELPAPEVILQAAKVVLPQFPYEEIEDYNNNTLLNGSQLNISMIQNDFPTMTLTEIQENMTAIEQYYSNNLDYLVLQEIANHPEIYNNNVLRTNVATEIYIASCTIGIVALQYGFVRSTISYALAGNRSDTSSENYFPNLAGSNDRRDAYRHTLWNALLAQYYLTISSKSKRLDFAKLVTDAREGFIVCNLSQPIADSKEMDLHNNYIGRRIWDENTQYRYIFGTVVALDRPTTRQLKNYCLEAVAKNSCYIVKEDKRDDDIFDYTTAEVQQQIIATNINTVVYFVGTIAPRWTKTIVTLDYSACEGFGDIIEKEGATKGTNINRPPLDDNCIREIYTTSIIDACFVSKDPNYNPYSN